MGEGGRPFHNPFGALESLKNRLPGSGGAEAPPSDSPKPPVPASKPAPNPAGAGKQYARAVVRMERTGRGGKEVTVVEQLDLQPRELETWLKELKGALGCGGVVEDRSLVLQGDHRKRLPDILARRGVKRVIIG